MIYKQPNLLSIITTAKSICLRLDNVFSLIIDSDRSIDFWYKSEQSQYAQLAIRACPKLTL